MAKIDKKKLYGKFQESADRDGKLKEDIVRKSLDIPVPLGEDMNISTGINGRHLVALATLAGVLFLAWRWIESDQGAPAAQPPPAKAQEYDVTFWAEDGTQIEVKEDSPADPGS